MDNSNASPTYVIKVYITIPENIGSAEETQDLVVNNSQTDQINTQPLSVNRPVIKDMSMNGELCPSNDIFCCAQSAPRIEAKRSLAGSEEQQIPPSEKLTTNGIPQPSSPSTQADGACQRITAQHLCRAKCPASEIGSTCENSITSSENQRYSQVAQYANAFKKLNRRKKAYVAPSRLPRGKQIPSLPLFKSPFSKASSNGSHNSRVKGNNGSNIPCNNIGKKVVLNRISRPPTARNLLEFRRAKLEEYQQMLQNMVDQNSQALKRNRNLQRSAASGSNNNLPSRKNNNGNGNKHNKNRNLFKTPDLNESLPFGYMAIEKLDSSLFQDDSSYSSSASCSLYAITNERVENPRSSETKKAAALPNTFEDVRKQKQPKHESLGQEDKQISQISSEQQLCVPEESIKQPLNRNEDNILSGKKSPRIPKSSRTKSPKSPQSPKSPKSSKSRERSPVDEHSRPPTREVVSTLFSSAEVCIPPSNLEGSTVSFKDYISSSDSESYNPFRRVDTRGSLSEDNLSHHTWSTDSLLGLYPEIKKTGYEPDKNSQRTKKRQDSAPKTPEILSETIIPEDMEHSDSTDIAEYKSNTPQLEETSLENPEQDESVVSSTGSSSISILDKVPDQKEDPAMETTTTKTLFERRPRATPKIRVAHEKVSFRGRSKEISAPLIDSPAPKDDLYASHKPQSEDEGSIRRREADIESIMDFIDSPEKISCRRQKCPLVKIASEFPIKGNRTPTSISQTGVSYEDDETLNRKWIPFEVVKPTERSMRGVFEKQMKKQPVRKKDYSLNARQSSPDIRGDKSHFDKAGEKSPEIQPEAIREHSKEPTKVEPTFLPMQTVKRDVTKLIRERMTPSKQVVREQSLASVRPPSRNLNLPSVKSSERALSQKSSTTLLKIPLRFEKESQTISSKEPDKSEDPKISKYSKEKERKKIQEVPLESRKGHGVVNIHSLSEEGNKSKVSKPSQKLGDEHLGKLREEARKKLGTVKNPSRQDELIDALSQKFANVPESPSGSDHSLGVVSKMLSDDEEIVEKVDERIKKREIITPKKHVKIKGARENDGGEIIYSDKETFIQKTKRTYFPASSAHPLNNKFFSRPLRHVTRTIKEVELQPVQSEENDPVRRKMHRGSKKESKSKRCYDRLPNTYCTITLPSTIEEEPQGEMKIKTRKDKSSDGSRKIWRRERIIIPIVINDETESCRKPSSPKSEKRPESKTPVESQKSRDQDFVEIEEVISEPSSHEEEKSEIDDANEKKPESEVDCDERLTSLGRRFFSELRKNCCRKKGGRSVSGVSSESSENNDSSIEFILSIKNKKSERRRSSSAEVHRIKSGEQLFRPVENRRHSTDGRFPLKNCNPEVQLRTDFKVVDDVNRNILTEGQCISSEASGSSHFVERGRRHSSAGNLYSSIERDRYSSEALNRRKSFEGSYQQSSEALEAIQRLRAAGENENSSLKPVNPQKCSEEISPQAKNSIVEEIKRQPSNSSKATDAFIESERSSKRQLEIIQNNSSLFVKSEIMSNHAKQPNLLIKHLPAGGNTPQPCNSPNESTEHIPASGNTHPSGKPTQESRALKFGFPQLCDILCLNPKITDQNPQGSQPEPVQEPRTIEEKKPSHTNGSEPETSQTSPSKKLQPAPEKDTTPAYTSNATSTEAVKDENSASEISQYSIFREPLLDYVEKKESSAQAVTSNDLVSKKEKDEVISKLNSGVKSPQDNNVFELTATSEFATVAHSTPMKQISPPTSSHGKDSKNANEKVKPVKKSSILEECTRICLANKVKKSNREILLDDLNNDPHFLALVFHSIEKPVEMKLGQLSEKDKEMLVDLLMAGFAEEGNHFVNPLEELQEELSKEPE